MGRPVHPEPIRRSVLRFLTLWSERRGCAPRELASGGWSASTARLRSGVVSRKQATDPEVLSGRPAAVHLGLPSLDPLDPFVGHAWPGSSP